MIVGRFRDGHPRVRLTLPGGDGPFDVEFIVDTGFEGDLTLPGNIARLLPGSPTGLRQRLLADGTSVVCPYYRLRVEDEDTGESRVLEVLVLPGNPLLGTTYVAGYLLQIEVKEGGELLAEQMP